METLTYQTEISNHVERVFDEEIQLTGITEFGISWEDLVKGNAQLPAQGARFNLEFEGSVNGENINGVIKGVDYLEIRADGKFMLNIHATIITDDGETISVKETGISTPDPLGKAVLHLNMDFYTVSEKYEWLNKKQVWSVGEVDMTTGKVKVTGFSN
jgi:hypothetical protein